ncbi:MAG: GNAT family N-acetyltransferase [Oscillospiraceae bacterium]
MNFTWKYGKNEIADCYNVRKKVFIEEQGFNPDTEFDDIDEKAYHLLVCVGGDPVATARLFDEEHGFHCGRICVVKEYRGKNIGLAIMSELENKAKELGAISLELSAQIQAVNFYEKCGYTKFGNKYLDEHCPHVMMKKSLES